MQDPASGNVLEAGNTSGLGQNHDIIGPQKMTTDLRENINLKELSVQ